MYHAGTMYHAPTSLITIYVDVDTQLVPVSYSKHSFSAAKRQSYATTFSPSK